MGLENITCGIPMQTIYPNGKISKINIQKTENVIRIEMLVQLCKISIRKVQVIYSKPYSLEQYVLQ